MSSRHWLRIVPGIIWLTLSPGAIAHAQISPESLIEQGIEMRRKGQDVKAHGYFKRAYDLSPTPRAASQLGLVEQAIGHFGDAEAHLSEALATDDAWVEEHRSVLEISRQTVRSRLGKLVVRGLPPGATVARGNRPSVAVPPEGIVWLNPGTTVAVFAAPDHASVTRTVTLAAGVTMETSIDLPPLAKPAGTSAPPVANLDAVPSQTLRSSPAPVDHDDRSVTGPTPAGSPTSGVRVASYVVGGVGILAFGAGSYFGLRSFDKWRDRNAHCHGSEMSCDAIAVADASAANTAATLADISFGLGVVAVATGVYLWLRSDTGDAPPGDARQASRMSVGPALGPGVGGLVLDGRW